MNRRVAIIGVGHIPPRTLSSDLSYKEMIYNAASAAYADAGLSPKDIDGFVGCAEDFLEGTSIFDEYTPDQLGAMQRPVHTITGDGLHGLAAAVMQIETGLMNRVLVEAHSKASNILSLEHILNYAVDPVFNRPLDVHPYAWVGLEMRAYLESSGASEEDCARVVAKNKRAGATNPEAPYGGELGTSDILGSRPLFDPLKELEAAPHSDGAVVMILAAADAIPDGPTPVWLKGIGWISDSPTLESRAWGESAATRLAAEMAYKQAGIDNPVGAFDVAEVDDTFAFKELQHADALGLFGGEGAAAALRAGKMDPTGEMPVNPSGGSLGKGNLLEANGLYRAAEIVSQLRGEAGRHQVTGAAVGVAQSWRGTPSSSAAVAVFSAE